MPNIAASVASLERIKDVTPEIAKAIRAVWKTNKASEIYAASPQTKAWRDACYNPPTFRECKRHAINCILGTHGIEYLGQHKKTGAGVYYCNAGDSYATTVVFIGAHMYVRDLAYYVEKNLIRYVQ